MSDIKNGKISFTIADDAEFTLTTNPYGYETNIYTTPDATESTPSITSSFTSGLKEKTYYVKGTGTLSVQFAEYVNETTNTPLVAGQLTGVKLNRVASVATKGTSYKEITLLETDASGTFANVPMVPTDAQTPVEEGTPTVYIAISTLPTGYILHDKTADGNVLSTKLYEATESTRSITFLLDKDPEYRTINFQEWGYDGLAINGGTATITPSLKRMPLGA